jgi:hypothetical protein
MFFRFHVNGRFAANDELETMWQGAMKTYDFKLLAWTKHKNPQPYVNLSSEI